MPSLGHTSNLVSDHLSNIRYTSRNVIMQLINDSWNEYALTMNGSPVGNDAEAIVIRLIRKSDHKEFDILLTSKL